jgi:ketosteroid isomerase-like protein
VYIAAHTEAQTVNSNAKGDNAMNRIGVAILLALAWAGVTFAQAPAPAAKGPSTAEAVKQLEHDWTDAEIAGDVEKLGQILADDWMGIGYDGKRDTKQAVLADLKSGKSKLESAEFGPMDVKVLGNVAVVQGSDTEKSTIGGKDTSGKWVWMDVFVKRGGKWMAVRSQSAMVK